jgi:hypothetical protein
MHEPHCKDANLNLQMTLIRSYQCHYAILNTQLMALWLISYMAEGCQHLHWICWVVCRCRNVGTLYLATFEVIMAVTMMITVSWDVAPCNVVDYYHHFRETYYTDLHPWRWRQQVPRPNRTSWMSIYLSYMFLFTWPKCCSSHSQLKQLSFLMSLSYVVTQNFKTLWRKCHWCNNAWNTSQSNPRRLHHPATAIAI